MLFREQARFNLDLVTTAAAGERVPDGAIVFGQARERRVP